MLNIIITNPTYDDTTSYLSEYTKEIIIFANNHGLDVTQLKRPRLTKKHFSAFVDKKDPAFIFFNGHGDADTIFGDRIKNKEKKRVVSYRLRWLISTIIPIMKAATIITTIVAVQSERSSIPPKPTVVTFVVALSSK